jgi:hypothetical protein
MSEKLYISNYCSIRNNTIFLNGTPFYTAENPADFNDFVKTAFRSLQSSYPKFFKMDNLSKLAFLTNEVLLKDLNMVNFKENEVAVIIQNASSSIDTDLDYFKTISDKSQYYPNPSLFVYTLPNIMIGEICIRKGFKGENMLIVSKKFNPQLLHSMTTDLIINNRAKCCIAGWVEFKRNNDEQKAPFNESFLCLIQRESNDNNSIELNINNINDLYTKNE